MYGYVNSDRKLYRLIAPDSNTGSMTVIELKYRVSTTAPSNPLNSTDTGIINILTYVGYNDNNEEEIWLQIRLPLNGANRFSQFLKISIGLDDMYTVSSVFIGKPTLATAVNKFESAYNGLTTNVNVSDYSHLEVNISSGNRIMEYLRANETVYFLATDNKSNFGTELCDTRLCAIYANKIYTVKSINDTVVPVFRAYNQSSLTPTPGVSMQNSGNSSFILGTSNTDIYIYGMSEYDSKPFPNNSVWCFMRGNLVIKSYSIIDVSKIIFNLTPNGSSTIALDTLIKQNKENPFYCNDPYAIRWTLDKPFSLVDAISANAKPSPLLRQHIYTVDNWKTLPATYSLPNLYRINHYNGKLIANRDIIFTAVARPLIQGGGNVLLNLNGNYEKYDEIIKKKNRKIRLISV